MKVIYHHFAQPHHTSIISILYEKYNWNPVCIAGTFIDDDGTVDGVSLKDCIISDTYKLRRSEFNYAEIASPIPIDSLIIDALSEYESTYIDSLGMFQDKTGW